MYKVLTTKLKIEKKIFFFFTLVSISFLLSYFNYVILSKILSPKDFGIFYTSIVLLNIFTTPIILYNFYISKEIINSLISNKFKKIQERFSGLFFLSFVYFFILQIFFLLFSFYFEINYKLYFIISLITFFQCFIEYLRLILDIEKNLIRSSSYTFFFNLLKFIFCVLIVLIYTQVWIVLLGFLIAQFLVIFHYYYRSELKINFQYKILKKEFNFDFINFSFFFILMIIFSYVDVLLSYFLLTDVNEFSSYSSSTVIPKSILMFTLPFIKAIYPNLLYEEKKYKKIVTFFIFILIILFTILSIIFVSNYFFPSILKIENVRDDVLFYSSCATFFAISNIFLILYNLANRKYNELLIGFSISILYLLYLFQKPELNSIIFALSALKLYGISFCIFLSINILNK